MVLKWFTLLVLLKYLNSVILGGCFGAGNYGMCGRAYDPRMMYMWPTGKISVMGGEQAVGVLIQINKESKKKSGKQMTE